MEKTAALRRIDCLDGIRAMAAVMVMAFHFVGHHDESARVIQISTVGQTGVDLFFVLSGFLITRILLLSKGSPHFFRAFYVRRALRIFPLYYGFLAIFYFVLPPIFGSETPAFRRQWWTWVYLQNLPATFPQLPSEGPNQFWSLAVEEHFYLAWPLLVFALPPRHFGRVILLALIAPLLMRLVFLGREIEIAYFTLTRLDALGYGALLAFLLTGETATPDWQVPLFRGLLIVLPTLLLPTFIVPMESQPDWVQAAKFSLVPAVYFALLGFCIIDPMARPLTALFSARWLRWLGAISYGLYVFHPTCFAVVDTFIEPPGFALDAVISFGLTILVAFVSFRFFESPILRLKRLFPHETPGGTS